MSRLVVASNRVVDLEKAVQSGGLATALGEALQKGRGLWFGWDGSLKFGNVIAGLSASALTFGLIWFTPRIRILNPVRAHWVRPTNLTWLDGLYQTAWNVYRLLGRWSNIFSNILEGDSGIMWTLLFLVLFITFFTQRIP